MAHIERPSEMKLKSFLNVGMIENSSLHDADWAFFKAMVEDEDMVREGMISNW